MDILDTLRELAISAPAILIAITFHELSHGFIADRLGDPTAKMMGRLTVNPFAHIDLFGTIIMPIMLLVFTNGQFVFGYAKPVPINPMNFRDPKRDMAISAASGPITNILLALTSVLLLKYVVFPAGAILPDSISDKILQPIAMMLKASILINVVLSVFNMIPVPPLDGGRVLIGFLPPRQAYLYSKIEPFGMIIVIILIFTGIARYLVSPLVDIFLRLLILI